VHAVPGELKPLVLLLSVVHAQLPSTATGCAIFPVSAGKYNNMDV
jgi:hypothetical protein